MFLLQCEKCVSLSNAEQENYQDNPNSRGIFKGETDIIPQNGKYTLRDKELTRDDMGLALNESGSGGHAW